MSTITVKEQIINYEIGQYWKRLSSKNIYLLSMVDAGKYCLIDMNSGNRYNDPVSTINEVFGDYCDDFVLIKDKSTIIINIDYQN